MIEYKVRPVVRYIVTKFEQSTSQFEGQAACSGSVGSSVIAECPNEDAAEMLAQTLRNDHERRLMAQLDGARVG